MMGFKELMETNPTFIVQLCMVLGAKELLAKAYERFCKKKDEEDADHKLLMETVECLNSIKAQLDKIEQTNKEGLENDILLLEHNILFLQRKAISYKKVSKGCMPRYRMLFKRYKALLAMSNMDINEEAETNNEIVEKMFHDGHVVESFWEMYK